MSRIEKPSIIDKFVTWFSKFWLNHFKPWWSRLRWHKYLKEESAPVPKVTKKNMKSILKTVHDHYEWKADGITELTDSYRPLPYVYNMYVDAKDAGTIFQDDCDGAHSVIYHIWTQNEYDCALITLVTKPFTKSHTMCAFKINGAYYVVNYQAIKGPYVSLQDFVDDYSEPVRYWNLQKYDYTKQKFYTVENEAF